MRTRGYGGGLSESKWHPKVVQEMLGHASTTLTMDTCSHVLPEMREESAAGLDALLALR